MTFDHASLTDRSPQSAVRLVRIKRREVASAKGYAPTLRRSDVATDARSESKDRLRTLPSKKEVVERSDVNPCRI